MKVRLLVALLVALLPVLVVVGVTLLRRGLRLGARATPLPESATTTEVVLAKSNEPEAQPEKGWQEAGLRGPSWYAAAKKLTDDERRELANLTPNAFGGQCVNATSSWNKEDLRWEEDFYGYPGKNGRVGPRAILPLEAARASFRARAFAGMKRIKLEELRKVPGFVALPPGGSLGSQYGGEKAVWDVYYEGVGDLPGWVVRGHVGSVTDSADSFTSRSLGPVPAAGLRSNILGSISNGFTAYLVPHDMAEPLTESDPALKPYWSYRKQHAEDLAKRGPVPHAKLQHPRAGYLKIEDDKLLRYIGGTWTEIADWKPAPDGEGRPWKGCVDRSRAVLVWPDGANSGTLYEFKSAGYWAMAAIWFGRTSDNWQEIGPTLGTEQTNEICKSLVRNHVGYYCGVPIIGREPWPQGVYDEDRLIGLAGSKSEEAAYYGWDRDKQQALAEAK